MPLGTLKELCKERDVAIFGGGASGRAAAKLLEKVGIGYKFYSESGEPGFYRTFDAQTAKKHNLVVYSPAFKPSHKWLELARENGLKTLCEPDIAAMVWNGKIYSITGTNGKTTLTSFLTHALLLAGFDAFAAGNIGKPLSEFCAENWRKDNHSKIAVCEVSSFQSMKAEYFYSDALLWTNFAPDHLDWHTDMREYFWAKLRLTELLKNNVLYVGKSVATYAADHGIALQPFAHIVDFGEHFKAPAPFDSPVQRENYMLARSFWLGLGLEEKILEKAAETFELAQFRFGETYEKDGVRFMNDSKATNAHAAIAALNALRNECVIWIGGGKNKFCDNAELVEAVKSTARGAFLIGQTAQELKANLTNGLKNGAEICNSLEDAVVKAANMAVKEGEACKKSPVVLFSPGFSSFGMFESYSHRGKVFKSSVLGLKNLKIQ